jgi:hypothetical protein
LNIEGEARSSSVRSMFKTYSAPRSSLKLCS